MAPYSFGTRDTGARKSDSTAASTMATAMAAAATRAAIGKADIFSITARSSILARAHVTNVYNKTVVNNISVTRVSFNGGNGGVRAAAHRGEAAAGRDRHIEATAAQREHAQTARSNPDLRAASNHGHPPIAATPRAGNFSNPIPARNAVMPTRNAAGGAERAAPQPRLSTPRPAPESSSREPARMRRRAPCPRNA